MSGCDRTIPGPRYLLCPHTVTLIFFFFSVPKVRILRVSGLPFSLLITGTFIPYYSWSYPRYVHNSTVSYILLVSSDFLETDDVPMFLEMRTNEDLQDIKTENTKSGTR